MGGWYGSSTGNCNGLPWWPKAGSERQHRLLVNTALTWPFVLTDDLPSGVTKEVETKSSSSIRFTVHKLQVYHTSFFLLSFHMDLFIGAKRVARPCNDMDPREHERRQSWAVMLYLPFSWTDSAASDAEYPQLALSSTSTSTFAPTVYPGTAWEQPWSTFPPKTGACTQLWPPATSQTWHLCFNVEGDLWTNCSGEREISQPWLTDG